MTKIFDFTVNDVDDGDQNHTIEHLNYDLSTMISNSQHCSLNDDFDTHYVQKIIPNSQNYVRDDNTCSTCITISDTFIGFHTIKEEEEVCTIIDNKFYTTCTTISDTTTIIKSHATTSTTTGEAED